MGKDKGVLIVAQSSEIAIDNIELEYGDIPRHKTEFDKLVPIS